MQRQASRWMGRVNRCYRPVQDLDALLHLHPRYYAVELVRGELVELDDVRGKPLDDREYLPDDVRGNDVLDAVENGLLVYARLPQYLLYVRHLHVTDLYFKGS